MHNWYSSLFNKCVQLLAHPCPHTSISSQYKRILCPFYHIDSLLNSLAVSAWPPYFNSLKWLAFCIHLCYILRKLQMRDSWPFHLCKLECLSHNFRNDRRCCDRGIPLCYWLKRTHNINKLEILLVKPMQAALPSNCYNRHIAKMRIRQACCKVHCAWPKSSQAYPCFSG